jgi:hypothetical protein
MELRPPEQGGDTDKDTLYGRHSRRAPPCGSITEAKLHSLQQQGAPSSLTLCFNGPNMHTFTPQQQVVVAAPH